MGKWEKCRLGAVAAARIWELGRVIRYQSHTKIIADQANVQKRFWGFCVLGNFIYLSEHDVEHVLRNVIPFWLVMKGSKNLSTETGYDIRHRRDTVWGMSSNFRLLMKWNQVRHTTPKGQGIKDKIILRRWIYIDFKLNKKTNMACRTYTTKMLCSGHLSKEGKTSPREHRYDRG
jgi:hypothetical protein